MVTIEIETHAREEILDVTDEVARLARTLSSGVIWLHCPHTTCALTIQENADPDLRVDYLAQLRRLVPEAGFLHAEGNADAHIKASLIGSTQPILVESGRLVLGRWQAIWLVELDGPRRRQLLARATAV
ncbi:MAG TPA: secondary thiamine-phosphate synthase enzyme YjbQ [Polyangia bacterium]|jgi:secondary thiamine-phosphate synthase enzyme